MKITERFFEGRRSHSRKWQTISNENLGILTRMDAVFWEVQKRSSKVFDDYSGPGLFLASDYSGHHRSAKYEAYSFVITTPVWWRAWERNRRYVRQSLLLNRRLSFKSLNDQKQWEALPIFLAAAASLRGLCFTLLVNKTVGSLFSPDTLDRSRPE